MLFIYSSGEGGRESYSGLEREREIEDAFERVKGIMRMESVGEGGRTRERVLGKLRASERERVRGYER